MVSLRRLTHNIWCYLRIAPFLWSSCSLLQLLALKKVWRRPPLRRCLVSLERLRLRFAAPRRRHGRKGGILIWGSLAPFAPFYWIALRGILAAANLIGGAVWRRLGHCAACGRRWCRCRLYAMSCVILLLMFRRVFFHKLPCGKPPESACG